MRTRSLSTAVVLGALIAPLIIGTPALAATDDPLTLSDDMNRTVSRGLGSSAAGVTYDAVPAASFSVAGGVAKLAPIASGATATLRPQAVSLTDSTQSVVFTLPALPKSGSGVYLSLQSRLTSSGFYQVQVRVDPRGVVLLEALRVNGSTQTSLGHVNVPELKVKAGVPLTLETRITGSSAVTIDARVTATAAAPGAGWKLSVTDKADARLTAAGRTGARVYVSRSTPAQAVAFDDLRITENVATPTAPPTAPKPPVTPTTPTAPTTPTTPTAPTTPTTPAAPATSSSMPAWNLTGSRIKPGAAVPGATSYAVPAGAVFVKASATTSGTGTAASPYSTLQRAVTASPAGSTIVVRGGTYHENVTVPAGKRVTIQSYPGEAVWLDGSEKLTGWKASGAAWYVSGWTQDFDSTPSFTKGEADGTAAGWRWLNADRPMAAHPEQVWIAGTPLREVGSLAQLKAGTFFTDTAADRLYIGSDPAKGEVRASTLTKAMSVRAEGTVVRGIGVRGYATSVWMMGAVTVEAPKTTIENVALYDNASTGLFVGAADATLKKVTVARNGLMGIGANYADRLKVTGLLAVENNSEGFNTSPVSGGLKIAKTQTFSVTDSAFLRNNGPGLWTDQSVSDIDIARNDFAFNTGAGVFLELSHRVDFVNNLVLNNKGNGVKINNTGSVQMWNNTIVGGNRTVNIVQDSRSALDPSVPGHDPRRPLGDPGMPWLIKDITIGNNVIAQSSGNCTLCVEDYTAKYTGAQLKIISNGNVFQRTSATTPSWLVIWSRGSVNPNPAIYTSLSAYTTATQQDKRSVSVDARAITGANGALLPADAVAFAAVPTAPASSVTGLIGTTQARLGAIFP